MVARNGEVAPVFLIASYYHAFFDAKAGVNRLCGFFVIIDILSKIGF